MMCSLALSESSISSADLPLFKARLLVLTISPADLPLFKTWLFGLTPFNSLAPEAVALPLSHLGGVIIHASFADAETTIILVSSRTWPMACRKDACMNFVISLSSEWKRHAPALRGDFGGDLASSRSRV